MNLMPVTESDAKSAYFSFKSGRGFSRERSRERGWSRVHAQNLQYISKFTVRVLSAAGFLIPPRCGVYIGGHDVKDKS